MHHIAIMNKKWKLIDKILSGEKKIESRWYVNKIAPWGRIDNGDVIYFKDSGCPITAKAEVEKVLYFARENTDLFANIQEYNANLILQKYGKGICIQEIEGFDKYANSKNYCILIFLKNPKRIEPFNIDKTGFGSACAWLCVENVERIKL
ncbi:MAG: hypothetical protein N4A43_04835 [Alphaproteobacteria bacterium]|jgi:predicted transcriptional regulator|nr:hypothetical protein [Alphaproteobacteria bacterium]